MKFECDSCHAQYMIADEKVGKRGVKVKCKKCQHVIIVRPAKGAADDGAQASEKEEKPAKPAKEPRKEPAKSSPRAPAAQDVKATVAHPGPGLDFSAGAATAAAEGDPFAAGGARNPFAGGGARNPPPPPADSDEHAAASRAPPGREADEPAEDTGPHRKPAPVSMMGGDATQVASNMLEMQQRWAQEDKSDDRTDLAVPNVTAPASAQADKTVVFRHEYVPDPKPSPPTEAEDAPAAAAPPAPPAPEPDPAPAAKFPSKAAAAPPDPPSPPPPASFDVAAHADTPGSNGPVGDDGQRPSGGGDDELGDHLAGAFSALFDAAGGSAASEPEDDRRGPTRILEQGAVDVLRKAARPDFAAELPGAAGLFDAPRQPDGAAAGMDDGPAEQVWHVAIDDQEVGPLTLAEVGRHIESGRVDRESLVWKTGMDDWLPAGDVPSIRGLFDKVPLPKLSSTSAAMSSSPFDFGAAPDDPAPPGKSPFDTSDDDPSWRPHGLTDVYQAANLAEAAGMGGGLGGLGGMGGGMGGGIGGGIGGGMGGLAAGGLGVLSGGNGPAMKAPSSAGPAASQAQSAEPEWRPGAASALASLVSEELKRLDGGPPPGGADELAPADDASIQAPLFGMGAMGKALDAGPDVGEAMARVPSAPTGGPSFDPSRANYVPSSPFMAAPAPSKLSPGIIAAIGGGVLVLVLIIAVVVAFVAGGKDEPKIVVGPGGKAFVMGPNGTLIPLGDGEAKAGTDDPAKALAQAAPATTGSGAPKGGEAGAGQASTAPTPEAAPPPAGAPTGPSTPAEATGAVAANTPPPQPPSDTPTAPKKIVEKATARATPPPPKPDAKPERESKPAKGCDPVLDFDCKPGGGGASKPSGDVKDSLSKTDVLVVVKNNMGKVESCGAKTKTSGIIKMSWKIMPNGKTSEVQVADSKFAGTPAGSCVQNEIKGWRFPESKVTTPISFPMKLGG